MMNEEMNGQFKFDLDSEKALVVQGNSFAMARYDMSNMEQKLFCILLSTISQKDEYFVLTNFKVIDIAKMMDIHPNVLYRDLKKICENLMSTVYEVETDNGDWEMVNLFSYAKYKGKQGMVGFKLNIDAKPYLLQLKKFFFQFKLNNVLLLDGKYSIRLYQQGKSHLNLGSYIIPVDEFIKELKLFKKSYKRFSNIKARVILPAIEEINLKTDIVMDFEEIRLGRSPHSLKFYVKPKKQATISPTKSSKPSKSSNKINFNNFEGREYDYDALEKRLLGWEKSDTIEDVTKKR